MNVQRYTIHITPQGESLEAAAGQSLLEALAENGIFLRSDCGGKGACGKCVVKILDSDFLEAQPPSTAEQKLVGVSSLKAGHRLACRVEVCGDLSIEIPKQALLSPEVVQKPPLSKMLQPDYSASRRTPGRSGEYGLAVDLGTTTIAIYLCDLAANSVTATVSVKNPQSFFGEDVISRINAVVQDGALLHRLQRMAVRAIEWGAASLLKSRRIPEEYIKKMVVVGNSTMIHLFLAEDPTSLGVFPYRPRFVQERTLKADAVNFRFHDSISVLTLPLISGFLGADILGAALATDIRQAEPGAMLIDVGTNGEVMLRAAQGLLGTSCATGPAFEGATIRHGMPAVSGAIDAVRIDPGSGGVTCHLIQNNPAALKKAAGICGSGVVSAVAELLRAGILVQSGRFNPEIELPNLCRGEDGVQEFILVKGEESEMKRPITLTQKDVRAVQLAKGALITGIELLCREMRLDRPKQLLVAGGFGNFLNKEDAMTIGMFPRLADDDLQAVGNAAGEGAVLTLFDPGFLKKAKEVVQDTQVKDLAADPAFQEKFVKSLDYPKP
ncbi:MAG: DUF4445 domain-containing protein [Deltaproteobacteria bacterium]|nr:DUF4445 domain-containing protein [Deltaproteobacteria bacterium]MBW2085984.1 DUF4445 domain-containing protein [Deltaproteobacteria bacterium]